MAGKIYKIDDIDFNLNTDLTLDELEFVQKFFKKTSTDGTTISLGEFKKEEIIEFLKIILIPIKAHGIIEWGKIKESVQIDAIKDFFLSRMQRMNDLLSSSKVSTVNSKKQ